MFRLFGVASIVSDLLFLWWMENSWLSGTQGFRTVSGLSIEIRAYVLWYISTPATYFLTESSLRAELCATEWTFWTVCENTVEEWKEVDSVYFSQRALRTSISPECPRSHILLVQRFRFQVCRIFFFEGELSYMKNGMNIPVVLLSCYPSLTI